MPDTTSSAKAWSKPRDHATNEHVLYTLHHRIMNNDVEHHWWHKSVQHKNKSLLRKLPCLERSWWKTVSHLHNFMLYTSALRRRAATSMALRAACDKLLMHLACNTWLDPTATIGSKQIQTTKLLSLEVLFEGRGQIFLHLEMETGLVFQRKAAAPVGDPLALHDWWLVAP